MTRYEVHDVDFDETPARDLVHVVHKDDPDWDGYANILGITAAWANLSPDPSTQNAAMLASPGWGKPSKLTPSLDTLSVNEFPAGVEYTDERWERPLKYSIIEHAERNAIYKAARSYQATDGQVLVAFWAACADCARAIIQTGISELVTMTPTRTPHGGWDDSIKVAMEMLKEAGVVVTFVDGPLGLGFTLRRNGQAFEV